MRRLLNIWRRLGKRKKTPKEADLLSQYEDLLVDRVDPDYGLLGRLRACKALTPDEVDKIKVQPTYRERNAKLIRYISTGGKFKEFISALRTSDQSHIANYLEARGDYRDFTGNDWPLTEEYISILETNKESLVDLIDLGSSGLLQLLYAKRVINGRQRDALGSVRVAFEANDCFLEILRRRSIADYAMTIECLRETNQGHVAKTLDDGGAIVPVHANIITGTAGEIEAAELRIVSLCHLILDRLPDTMSAEETQEILENVRLHIIAIKKGNSLVLYVRCVALEDLNHLERLLASEEINVLIKAMIVRVIPSFRQSNLTTYALERDLKKAESYFQTLKTRQTDSVELCKENTELYDLPLELLDMILKKSYLCSVIRENKREREKSDSVDKDIVERLAKVNSHWLQRVIKTRFKNTIWSHLSKYYKRTTRNSSFYKSNRSYIEENIELNSLLRSLKSDDLLNDIETACVKRKRYLAGKGHLPIGLYPRSTNFLDFERLLSEVGRDSLIHGLWNSKGQKSMARILEDGGVVVRAEFQNTFRKRPWSHEVSRQLSSTNNKTKSRSKGTDPAIGQLTKADLEVVGAVEDRGTSAWVWCRSANALNALKAQSQNVNELFQLLDSLIETIEEKPAAKFKRVDVNIDRDQLEKELVLLSSVVQFTARLDLEEKCLVYGVTKLMQRIHVICRGIFSSYSLPSPTLYIFEDEDPFRLLVQVDLNEVSCPLDIASSAKENCLYVLDSWIEGNNCLWKIEENSEGKNVVTRWLEFEEGFRPATLSVSSDGLVLVVSWNRDGSSQPVLLRLYGPPRAELQLALSLPREVRDPVHAVRVATGNFIIIHQVYAADDKERGNDDVKAGKEQKKNQKQEEKDSGDYCYEEAEENDDKEGQELAARRGRDGNKTTVSVVSEVSSDGATIVRRFCPQNEDQRLNISLYYDGGYFCVDSKGRIYVSDTWNHRVILLDPDLRWNRVLVPSKWTMCGREGRAVLLRPWKLFYDEEKSQVVVGGGREAVVCALRRS